MIIAENVYDIFFFLQKMDLNQDGVVSLEEFITFNKEDFKMVQSLDSLKTINV